MLNHVAAPAKIGVDTRLQIVRIALDHLPLESLRGARVAAEAHHGAQVAVLVGWVVAVDAIRAVTVHARCLACLRVAPRELVAALLLRSGILLGVYVGLDLL